MMLLIQVDQRHDVVMKIGTTTPNFCKERSVQITTAERYKERSVTESFTRSTKAIAYSERMRLRNRICLRNKRM